MYWFVSAGVLCVREFFSLGVLSSKASNLQLSNRLVDGVEDPLFIATPEGRQQKSLGPVAGDPVDDDIPRDDLWYCPDPEKAKLHPEIEILTHYDRLEEMLENL